VIRRRLPPQRGRGAGGAQGLKLSGRHAGTHPEALDGVQAVLALVDPPTGLRGRRRAGRQPGPVLRFGVELADRGGEPGVVPRLEQLDAPRAGRSPRWSGSTRPAWAPP
jgi:hypothetical protein